MRCFSTWVIVIKQISWTDSSFLDSLAEWRSCGSVFWYLGWAEDIWRDIFLIWIKTPRIDEQITCCIRVLAAHVNNPIYIHAWKYKLNLLFVVLWILKVKISILSSLSRVLSLFQSRVSRVIQFFSPPSPGESNRGQQCLALLWVWNGFLYAVIWPLLVLEIYS